MPNTTVLSKEEALRKVAEVLEEALAEYETLEKMDIEPAEDPSRPSVPAPEAAAADAAAAKEAKDEDDKDEDEDEDEDDAEADADEAKADADKKDDDKAKDDSDEESDDTLKSEFAALQAKMAKRGLLAKTEPKSEKTEAPAPALQKTESPVAEDKVESLKKSMDSELSELKKALSSISEVVNKIAAQPAAPRKGVSGYAPLKKSEEGSEQVLSKSQIIDKCLDLKKSGDRRVTATLINRIETNRLAKSDLDFIKSILG